MKSENAGPDVRGPDTSADSPDPDGVDGSDELAAAIGKSAGGICVAGGIFGAADDRDAA